LIEGKEDLRPEVRLIQLNMIFLSISKLIK
jgi:hypothetical protein